VDMISMPFAPEVRWLRFISESGFLIGIYWFTVSLSFENVLYEITQTWCVMRLVRIWKWLSGGWTPFKIWSLILSKWASILSWVQEQECASNDLKKIHYTRHDTDNRLASAK
jgi:hypothetical protein